MLRTARKPFLLRASLRAQVWSGGAEPGCAETVRETRGKAFFVRPVDLGSKTISSPGFRLIERITIPLQSGLGTGSETF